MMTNTDVVIGETVLTPYALDAPFRYLGATLRLDMSSTSAARALTGKINKFCSAMEAHKLRVDRAVWAVNTFLIPSLAYSMPFISSLASHRRVWDTRVAAAISRCMGEAGARKVLPEALVCITGLILPSHYDRMLTVSHTFFRLNDINPRAGSARLRWDASERPSSTLRSNRLGRARTVAADMHINMIKVVRSVRHKAVEERGLPSLGHRLHADHATHFFGHHGLWGLGIAAGGTITMYTDGSMQDGISSWAVCVRNEWLDFSFATLPGEDALRDVHLKGALLVGSALHQCEGSGVSPSCMPLPGLLPTPSSHRL